MAEPRQVPGVSCAVNGVAVAGIAIGHLCNEGTVRLEKLTEMFANMTNKPKAGA